MSGSPSTRRETPLGVYLIAILGGIGAVLGAIGSLGLVAMGGGFALLGVLLLVLSVAHLYVLVGLVRLRPWAWTWTLVIEGVSALLNLAGGDVLAVLISAVVIAYLFARADYFGK
jgi:hypothetical protein